MRRLIAKVLKLNHLALPLLLATKLEVLGSLDGRLKGVKEMKYKV